MALTLGRKSMITTWSVWRIFSRVEYQPRYSAWVSADKTNFTFPLCQRGGGGGGLSFYRSPEDRYPHGTRTSTNWERERDREREREREHSRENVPFRPLLLPWRDKKLVCGQPGPGAQSAGWWVHGVSVGPSATGTCAHIYVTFSSTGTVTWDFFICDLPSDVSRTEDITKFGLDFAEIHICPRRKLAVLNFCRFSKQKNMRPT